MTQPSDGLWPPVPDFNGMLQNPSVGFHDAELKTCEIERDVHRQPRPRAGNFAVCYKATLASNGKNACIRLFARKSEERRERYSQISAHLKANPLDCLVKFEYLEKGIRHPDPRKYGGGSWYPIVRMDWVEGSILFDWLRERCQLKDARAIGNAADQWIEVAQQLADAGIAHGDLQHANVMVTASGQLKLVDYDCMCVPALVGSPNLELGVEPYQHPDRNEETKLFPGLDHFSQLFILVVLRALAADPTLWFRHIEPPGGEPYDKLLIRKSDFESSDKSVLFDELKRSPDPEVGRLAKELFQLGKVPLDAVPPLSTFVFDFDDVRKLFRQRAWDEGLELLNRCRSGKIPNDLVAESDHARECVQARLELERTLLAGDEQLVQAAYKPKLLDDYPKAQPSVQAARLSPRVQAILSQLEIAKKGRNWRQFVSTWDADRAVLSDRKSAERYRSEVESWRERNDLCDKMRRLQSAIPIDATALGEACRALLTKGGHPEIDAEIPVIQRLVERLTAFNLYRMVPNILGEANDLALIVAWNETLFAGWRDAEQERPRMDSARTRLAKVRRLRDAIATADAIRSVDNEKTVKKSANDIPNDYELESTLKSRLVSTEACLAAVEQIEQTITLTTPSERGLAQGWKALCYSQAAAIVSAAVRVRLELATQRLPSLEKLAAINLRGSVDVVDTAIKAAWNDRLLHDCPDALPWKQRAADAVRRAELLALLDKALSASDDAAAVSLLDDPLLREYPFAPTAVGRIGTARKKTEKVRALIAALRDNRDEDFGKQFDQRILKANVDLFAPYQAQIVNVLSKEVLAVHKVGLSKPLVGRSVTNDESESNRYRVKWTWPAQRFTDQCLLGICRGTPQGQIDPAEIAVHRIPIDRQRWETGGGFYSLTAKSEWRIKRADVVAVWAVIDLGFSTFYSEPLVLGRVSHHEVPSGRD